MTRPILSLGACALLMSCAHAGSLPPPEPEIRTVEVKVAVPTPCKALEELGPEPTYPDTAAALKAAPNLYARVNLLVRGRILRVARLGQYAAARASC